MLRSILGLGIKRLVLLCTLFSVMLSVSITTALFLLTRKEIGPTGYFASVLSPLVTAPVVSGFVFHLLFKVDKLEREVRELATFDPLTKALNRRSFLASLETLILFLKRNSLPIALIFLDIDKFKSVNDLYGHEAGDRVIQGCAERLRACLRKGDLLCRYGGEEFIVALPQVNLDSGALVAEKLRRSIEEEALGISEARKVLVTISLGVTASDGSAGYDVSTLIRLADQAMYNAKRTGRNRVCRAEVDQPGEVREIPEGRA